MWKFSASFDRNRVTVTAVELGADEHETATRYSICFALRHLPDIIQRLIAAKENQPQWPLNWQPFENVLVFFKIEDLVSFLRLQEALESLFPTFTNPVMSWDFDDEYSTLPGLESDTNAYPGYAGL